LQDKHDACTMKLTMDASTIVQTLSLGRRHPPGVRDKVASARYVLGAVAPAA
jgi:hypothetical protein